MEVPELFLAFQHEDAGVEYDGECVAGHQVKIFELATLSLPHFDESSFRVIPEPMMAQIAIRDDI
jgi:hypothetical protein